jgi:shikimate kinase / 3-dehydroquinate synthase
MSHIFLYGPSGAGKSTVGQAIASNLKLPFVDLDRVIEANAGMSIPQIMAERGEPAFRDLETAMLKETVGYASSVTYIQDQAIALGGGALLREENRAIAESHGKVVVLMAELETLLERLSADANKRPLLAGDLREKLTFLLAKRREHYGSFPMLVHVDGRTIEQNAFQAQVILGRHHLSAMGEYDVVVGSIGQIGNLSYIQPLIVTDENVAKYHAAKVADALRAKMLVIPAGETHKNLDTINRLWHGFLEAELDRKSMVIALGGGVVSDMTGFAASTYMRGIEWICIPTTLLSMADASIGGKTGFDLHEGKNLVGSFHPPRLVLADPAVLSTLPEAEFRSGMAEVVKHGIISDPELFSLCGRGLNWVKNNLEEIVKRAMAVKIQVIEQDPYEKGIRAALNLGHTVGHAVELVSQFKLRHGEAVAIGMVAEARLAERLTVAGKGLAEAVAETLSALGLPIHIPQKMSHTEIIHAMRMDKKKNAKAIRFALPAEIGRVELVEITDLESVLE